MSGSISDETVMTIDYREAFVLDMEMVAHGQNCKPCILSALKSRPDDACVEMKYMREYVKRCYEALPPPYKQRYEEAMNVAFLYVNESIQGMVGGR